MRLTSIVGLVGWMVMGMCVGSVEARQDAPVKPVEHRKLRATLPEKLGDLVRDEDSVESQFMEIGEASFSTATAEYVLGDANATLTVNDMPFMAEMLKMFGLANVDREGRGGFERTTKVHDQPAMLRFQKTGDDLQGSAEVAVAGRFMITFTTSGVDAETFLKLVEQLPVQILIDLRME